MSDAIPFSDLEPDTIHDAMEAVGLRTDGRLLPLNSYENRVYRIGIEGAQPVVAKFYRTGRWSDEAIQEEHDFALELAEAEIPAVAPLVLEGETLHHRAGYRFTVFPSVGGRWPELATVQDRRQLGRYLGRLHQVGSTRDFQHRPRRDPIDDVAEAADSLLDSGALPAHMEEPWDTLVDDLLDAMELAMERVGDDVTIIRTHGDFHLGNILWGDDGPKLVDLDDAMPAPAVQDLWLLLSGERGERERLLGELLEGYQEFRPFQIRELAMIEVLRTSRMVCYAKWLAGHWEEPAFRQTFVWYGGDRYWEDLVLDLREQLAALAEPPLVPAD